jgi:hypothetical protein
MDKARNIDRIAAAILREDKKITIGLLTLELPAPQRAGTETQKLAYARLKANELLTD